MKAAYLHSIVKQIENRFTGRESLFRKTIDIVLKIYSKNASGAKL